MNRRAFLKSVSALVAGGFTATRPLGRALAFGESSDLTVGHLRYDGNWNPRPQATERLLLEVDKRTSILVDSSCPAVAPDSEALFDTPFAVLGGDRGFEPFSEAERRNLERYLRAGGTLLCDSSEGDPDGEFSRSVRRELAAILPDAPLTRVPSSHVLFKSFYLIDGAPGRVETAAYMEGCSRDGRLLVVYSHNDLMGAWSRDNFGNWLYEVRPGGERQREMAFRMGINLAMYVLCLDYKEDQVHVPFILHRRQWRID
jgi:hypothetical protein